MLWNLQWHAFKSNASAVGETKISGSTFKVSKGGVTGSSFLSQQRSHQDRKGSIFATSLPVIFWQETPEKTAEVGTRRLQHLTHWAPNPNFSQQTYIPNTSRYIPLLETPASSGLSDTHHKLCQPAWDEPNLPWHLLALPSFQGGQRYPHTFHRYLEPVAIQRKHP